MPMTWFVFVVAAAVALLLALARNWHTAVLLALIEVVWVALCGLYGVTLLATGDMFFLMWACLMLFFSAVELILSAVLFAHQNDGNGLAPLKGRQ